MLVSRTLRFIDIALALIVPAFGFCADGDPGSENKTVSLTVLARPPTPVGGQTTSLTGHIYVIVGVKTQTSVKESVYGFYPARGGLGQIKGPGMLTAENRCGIYDACAKKDYAASLMALSDITKSTKIMLTDAQHTQVMGAISNWAVRRFDLNDSNCVSFVEDVVKATGYTPPKNKGLTRLPIEYVAALDDAIKAQDIVNEARRTVKTMEAKVEAANADAKAARDKAAEADEAKRRAEDSKRLAEARAAAAEKQRADAARDANTVPDGWIACTCAQHHVAIGKVVGGKLWHPANIKCPN